MSSRRHDDEMNEHDDQSFEDNFNEAFDQSASRSSSPLNDESKQQSWQQLKQQLNQMKKRKQRKYHFQIACVIAVSMALGAVLFSPLTTTQAVTPVYQEIKDWGNSVVGQVLNKKSPDNKVALTPPPPNHEAGPDPEFPPAEVIDIKNIEFIDKDESLTESRKRSLIYIPEVQYIPEDYTFVEAYSLVTEDNPRFDHITLLYKNSDEKFLYIGFIGLSPDSRLGIGRNVIDSIVLENGTKANIREGGGIDFLYDNDQIVVHIGPLPREELITVANHIK